MTRLTALILALLLAVVLPIPSVAQDTTITYQGQLRQTGVPFNGLANLEFGLFDQLTGGSQVGSTQTRANWPVEDGLFQVELDFGAAVFNSSQRFLEVSVDAVPLSPRQPVHPSPMALFALDGNVGPTGPAGPAGPAGDSHWLLNGTATYYTAGNVGIGTSNPVYPLQVVSNGTISIVGTNDAVTGTSYGVWGESASTAGNGVFGLAFATSGFTNGVRGQSDSTSGRGVFGVAFATSGTTYGVWGQSASTAGNGVFGFATANTSGATGVGVRGQSASPAGRGVFGLATATSGSTEGVWGESASTTGRGVFGLATATSGSTEGVWGKSASPDGRGVFGQATATSGVNYGVSGHSASTTGTGVLGEATASSGAAWGVFGRSDSPTGRGVFGWATATSGVNYGVRGESASPDGFDFYAAGAGTNYGAASSRRWKHEIEPIPKPLEMMAALRGVYFNWDKEHGGQHDIGMIAEEVGAVVPEIVQYEENGIDAIGMDYSKLSPLLVAAVNALRAEKDQQIIELEARIAALEARLAAPSQPRGQQP